MGWIDVDAFFVWFVFRPFNAMIIPLPLIFDSRLIKLWALTSTSTAPMMKANRRLVIFPTPPSLWLLLTPSALTS